MALRATFFILLHTTGLPETDRAKSLTEENSSVSHSKPEEMRAIARVALADL
ncbi:hypothetical protein [uncultured Porphyromonas sp.]|uniref:hypothetical protein n=1 Tax=uncultured Porphyromonas sp. TaxID=159274 RepID=UPI0025D4123F|nr:hypothetical protein [uncultured Porphyromonas sp.]